MLSTEKEPAGSRQALDEVDDANKAVKVDEVDDADNKAKEVTEQAAFPSTDLVTR